MSSFRDLLAYQKGFELAMEIFEISKAFPKEEKYSLTDQVRRSSRSVCSNFGEAYRKRRYQDHFMSKLSDSDMENTETQIWLDFAFSCKYIDEVTYKNLIEKSEEIGKLLYYMFENPGKIK